MAHDDPYAPPSAELEEDVHLDDELATHGARLGAALLDSFLMMAITVPAMYFGGYFHALQTQSVTPAMGLGWAAFGLLTFVVVQAYPIHTRGQTVGKLLLGIQMVRLADGAVLPGWTLIGLRYLPVQLVGMVPMAGGCLSLVDVLFIFRPDRRCVHDHIAGTHVVRYRQGRPRT